MNIAVFGWYHHRNAGDDRIQYCISRWLDGHTLAFLPAGRPVPVHMLRTYDAAIIGGGGLIMTEGGVFKKMSRWISAAGIPVACVGVSVEALTPGLRDELREFLDQCCFGWFRDQASLDEIGPHPNAFVAPDITWLYPFPLLPAASNGVALCLRKRNGLAIEKWKRAVEQLGERVTPWPLYFEEGGDAEILRRVMPGESIPDEFNLAPLKESAIVIAERYHGVIFALQSGRPALAVSSLPKTRRFMKEHDLSQWCTSETEPEKLRVVLQSMNDNREKLLHQVLQLRSSLCQRVTLQAQKARELLLTAAGALPQPNRRWNHRVRQALDLGSYY